MNYKTNNKPRRVDDEESFHNNDDGKLGYGVKTNVRHNFIVHLNEEIKSPSFYSNIFDMLLNASEDDMVSFFIASPGGRLDGLSVLLEGLNMTDAYTVAVIVGEASSAASIFALRCDDIAITPSAEALIHSCRYGIAGKSADVESHVAHTTKITKKLMRETYEHFLSPDEIEEVLNGKEIYLDSEQLQERVDNRAKAWEDKHKAEAQALEEFKKKPVPKKATQKKA